MLTAKKYVRVKELSELTGITVNQLRILAAARKIPVVVAGHRTRLYDLEKVVAALEKFEVKAVA